MPPHVSHRWRTLALRALVAVVVVGMAVFVYHLTRTGLALYQARSDVSQLKADVARGDVARAKATLARLASHARTAHEQSRGPTWRFFSLTPWIGGDLKAVSTLAGSLDSAAGSSLPLALSIYQQVQDEPLRSSDGTFNLEALGRLAPRLTLLAASLDGPRTQVDAVDARSLVLPTLRRVVLQAQQGLDTVAALSSSGVQAARLLPTMMGGHGERTYVLVVQNNAETRATGGLPGSLVTLHARNGHLSLGKQHGTTDYRIFDKPVLPLSPAEVNLFGSTIGTDPRDTNLTPDFPRSAMLISAMYDRTFHEHVDGVISVDPVALIAVLRATGPVQLESSKVTADNVVSVLLNRSYQDLQTDAEQNAFFAVAAHAIFDALSHGNANQSVLIRGLTEAVNERHLLVWSAHPSEQAVFAGSALSGALPRGTGRSPEIGYYLNDGTSGKIEYYLKYAGSLRSSGCHGDGVQDLRASMRLTSTVPDDYLQLAPAIIGYGEFAPRGSMRVIVWVYGPAGGRITRVEADGKPVQYRTMAHDGRPVAAVDLLLGPGQEATLDSDFVTRPGQGADPRFEWTPSVRPGATSLTVPSSCT